MAVADQVKTYNVSISSVVGSAAFRSGVEDFLAGVERFDEFNSKTIRKGKGFRVCGWDYERGRQFAAYCKGASVSVPTTRDASGVKREAIRLFSQARGPLGIL